MANEIKNLLNSVDGVKKDWKEDWKEDAKLDWKTDFSFSPRLVAATISALAVDNSYNDSASGFVTAGFAVGQRVTVSGFTGNAANNIASGRITALTAAKMTIGGTDGDVIVDDTAGETVTIVASAEPFNTVIPAITGTATVGQTLTASTGTWVSGTPTYRYVWKRGSVIVGTNANTYVLQAADAGATITVTVTATTARGSADATSNATAAVAAS